MDTPYPRCFNREAGLKMFKPLGCTTLKHLRLPSRTKMEVTAEKGTLVGKDEGTICYNIYLHPTRRIVQDLGINRKSGWTTYNGWKACGSFRHKYINTSRETPNSTFSVKRRKRKPSNYKPKTKMLKKNDITETYKHLDKTFKEEEGAIYKSGWTFNHAQRS